MSERVVQVPRLTSRAGVAWAAGTAAAVVVAVGVLMATRPEDRWAGVVVLVLVVLGVLVVASERRWVEPEAGVVGSGRLWFWQRRVVVGPTAAVRLGPNRGGAVVLRVRGEQGRSVVVNVLLLSDYVERSLPPDVLVLLADLVEGRRAAGGRAVARALRGQAEHLARGGTPRSSPLASRVSYGVLDAAKAGGSGGIAGQL